MVAPRGPPFGGPAFGFALVISLLTHTAAGQAMCPSRFETPGSPIPISVACNATTLGSACTVSCPSGFRGETLPLICQPLALGGADWTGRVPVCYRYFPERLATANSLYEGRAVVHNAAAIAVAIAPSSSLVVRDFAITVSTGKLQGRFEEPQVGIHNVSLEFTFPGTPASFGTTFLISVAPPLLETATALALAQNTPFEGATPSLTGGNPPFHFFLQAGSLPLGLSVDNATGQLFGTPIQQGSFSAGIAATDAGGATIALQPLDLSVTAGLTVVWNRTMKVGQAVVGEQYALPPPPFTSNSQGRLFFSAGGELPPGIAVDDDTGTVFGVPTVARDRPFDLEIRAVDDTNVYVVVERLSISVRLPFDCDSPTNGPNRRGCGPGLCLDTVPFDNAFACNCSLVPFIGDNCDMAIAASNQGAGEGSSPRQTALIVACVLSFIAIVFGGVLVVMRRRHLRLEKQPFDFEAELDEMMQAGLLRTNNVPREIPRRKIKLLDKLGEGQFGDVFKGTVNESDATGVPEYLAAIKTLKDDPSGFEKKELMREAATMAQFDHPNVVNLIGACTSGMPYLLVVQFCEHGALNSFLKQIKEESDELDFRSAMRFAHDIAKGMAYLNGRGLIHRDLATRNVLLDSSYICKVADFGLSRDLGDSLEYYRSSGTTPIPVRWTAPEALADQKFSSQSDAWSYGITMHEIFTYAELPYKDKNNQMVWLQVKQGFRLPRERNCPAEFYDNVMMPCWDEEPDKRPSFTTIVSFLEGQYKLFGSAGADKSVSRHQTLTMKGPTRWSKTNSAATTSIKSDMSNLLPEDATGYVSFTSMQERDDSDGPPDASSDVPLRELAPYHLAAPATVLSLGGYDPGQSRSSVCVKLPGRVDRPSVDFTVPSSGDGDGDGYLHVDLEEEGDGHAETELDAGGNAGATGSDCPSPNVSSAHIMNFKGGSALSLGHNVSLPVMDPAEPLP